MQPTREDLQRAFQRVGAASKEIAETFAFFDVVRPWLRAAFADSDPSLVIDVGGGQGLAALCWLCLADTSQAVIVDECMPPSHVKTIRALRGSFSFPAPDYFVGKLEEFEPPQVERLAFVGIHCCGELSDELIRSAIACRAPFAVMTCCHPLRDPLVRQAAEWLNESADPSHLIDLLRLDRARSRGYRVELKTIDPAVTPKNRILLGRPAAPEPQRPRQAMRAAPAWEHLRTLRARRHHVNAILKAAGLPPAQAFEVREEEAFIEVRARGDAGDVLIRLARVDAPRLAAVEEFEREAEQCAAARAAGERAPEVFLVEGRGKPVRNVFLVRSDAPARGA